jgi:RNA polymerase sigma-B factor
MAATRAKRAGTVTGPEGAGHSGRLLLRMDPALHAELARAAEREGQSLNAYITSVLGDDLNGERQAEDPANRVAGRLIRAAVIADLVLVAVAAAIAIALLVIAWPT